MSAPTDPSAVLRGFASGIPEPQARWSRGEGLGGQPTTTEPKPKPEPKTEPKSEPKPTSTAAGTDADAKPAADTKTPDSPKPDTKAEPKKFSSKIGKPLTQLGVPPSAVRNIKSGEPMKGVKGLVKGQWNAGQHWAGKLGNVAAKTVPTALGKGALKTAARLIPGVGSLVAAYSAFHNFKQGDIMGGILNVIGVIPGPIGWIGIGASAIWEMSGLGDRYEEWQAPDGVDTHMLMRDAKDVANVKEIDAALQTAQQQVFSYQDGPTGSVWDRTPPPALELSTPEVVAAATEWLTGISDHFAAIDKALMNSGEQYFTEQRASLTEHFSAMAALSGQVKQLTDQLAAADKGGETAYKAVTGANAAARGQLASSGKLTDAGPATTMETEMQKGLSVITAANTKLDALWSETPAGIVAVRDLSAAGTRAPEKKTEPVKPAAVTPAAVAPTTQTPAAATPAKTETPTKNSDDLSKLLSQLGNKTQTPTSNPLGTGSGLGGGSPLGTGTGGGGNTGGTPLSSSKPDTSEKSEPKKLGDDKKFGERKETEPKKLDDKSLSSAKPEQAKAAVPKPEDKPGVAPAAVPAPGRCPHAGAAEHRCGCAGAGAVEGDRREGAEDHVPGREDREAGRAAGEG